jgi:protein tyrosine phosphatase (PTP) superfamily phosphohydrolase (DUF442 family)
MTVRRMVIGAIALAALAAIGYSQYWVATGRVATVEDGRLYRSAALPPDRLIEVCRRRGVRTVVDFRKEPAETQAEAAALARAGIRHVAIPSGQVPTPESVSRFLSVMDDGRSAPVLIHCTHGVGRTGVFAAIFRMEYHGWSPRLATLEAMLYSGFGSFGPGNSKAAFIAGYTPRAAARLR